MISSRLGKGNEGATVQATLAGIDGGARQCLQSLSALAHLYGNRAMAERALSQDARLVGEVCAALSGGLVSEPGLIYSSLAQAFECHGVDDVVYSAQVVRTLQLAELTTVRSGLDPLAFTSHAVGTAAGAASIAARAGCDPALARMAGLLHNTGVLFVARTYPDRYAAVLSGLTGAGLMLHDAESLAFGFDHQASGALVLAAFGFPVETVRSAGGHHGPVLKMSPLEKCVAAAAAITHQVGNSMGVCDASPSFDAEDVEDIHVGESDLCGLAGAVIEAVGRLQTVRAPLRTKCA